MDARGASIPRLPLDGRDTGLPWRDGCRAHDILRSAHIESKGASERFSGGFQSQEARAGVARAGVEVPAGGRSGTVAERRLDEVDRRAVVVGTTGVGVSKPVWTDAGIKAL